MKTFNLFSILALVSLGILSCKKNDTPESTGYAFKLEPVSISEIPNGNQYTFGAINFGTNSEVALQIKTASDTANCSIWNVYLVNANGNKYFLSGLGANGSSYYYTHHFYSSSSGKINIIITRTSGPAEEYSSVLVTRGNWR